MASGLTPPHPPAPEVRIFPDDGALARAAADRVASVIAEAVSVHGRCAAALAGGNTPRLLYQVLATGFRERVPWTRLHVFWGDERCVPPDDPRRNDRMARETLLDRVPIPRANIHPMPAHFADAEAAARDYEATLRAFFGPAGPRLDLILLGMGADGHTASLFPNDPALGERERWVVAVTGPTDPPRRLTLTLPVLNRARHVLFLVTGADKAHAVRRVLTESPAVHVCPAAGVRPEGGALAWWVDEAAASGLRGAWC